MPFYNLIPSSNLNFTAFLKPSLFKFIFTHPKNISVSANSGEYCKRKACFQGSSPCNSFVLLLVCVEALSTISNIVRLT
ncbi:unnamed protein product [Moneuplotes crassus]|uniref:Uncharacterized protein n=1 Tax=Euplotes crassus TaxID=5936 RepID=A0AAD1UH73_EUPCR|nr:unnamed protein product [Moneuplotes crassus]